MLKIARPTRKPWIIVVSVALTIVWALGRWQEVAG